MSKEFTSNTFVWLRQVAADRDLPATAARVAIIMTNYINRDLGFAWPSVSRLAVDLSISEATVRRALQALSKRGYLQTVIGGGRTGSGSYSSNTYRPVIAPDNAEKIARQRLQREEDAIYEMYMRVSQTDSYEKEPYQN